MNIEERRKFPRIAADNLHSNIKFTKDDNQSVSQIDCRVVNISLDGVQIETQYPIKSEHVHLGVIDSRKNPLEIKGRVVYCEQISPKMFYVGVSFIGSNMDKYKFMSQLMIPLSNSQLNIVINDEGLQA
ncbi:MAG: PilZ domain-containing protein [Desulfobacterales bacterium]